MALPAFVYIPVLACIMFFAGWLAQRVKSSRLDGRTKQCRTRLIDEARQESEEIIKEARLEAQELLLKSREQIEEEGTRLRAGLSKRQELLDTREASSTRKADFLDQKEARLDSLEQELRQQHNELSKQLLEVEQVKIKQMLQLEEIAGLTAEEAQRRLADEMVDKARQHAARAVKQLHEQTEHTAKRKAQKILALAVQRSAAQHVAEECVSVISLANDEMKGRIIGREGRNIRSFEEATGVDVIIDDTPEAVILSAFDPVRREIASQAMRRLLKDGRIHPGRIEEVVGRTRQEMHDRLRELGEQSCMEVGIVNLPVDFYPYIGRLHYRTSYGQIIVEHSKEVAAVAGIIASELGLDSKLARRCGFLHDIGKAVDHAVEGPHALIGGRMCRKFGEHATVINAVEGHHEDVAPDTPYTFITAAADAVSASRPGARRESLDSYFARLENLEKIACSFPGVQKSYAIQAGREIRILVDHALVSDEEAALLAEEVRQRVEEEMEYPGQIKIMVIRETRATALAK